MSRQDSTPLIENSFVYGVGVRWVGGVAKRGGGELLRAISNVARFAWRNHPGRFADGAIENPCLHEGLRLLRSQGSPLRRGRGSSHGIGGTLHVATTVLPSGGHSRVLANWVQRDVGSAHVIALTDQADAIPPFLKAAFEARSAPVHVLAPAATYEQKATALRELASGVDRVVLHTHPNDIIPVMAFAESGGPPVAMFNHAHFSFSLCGTVSDIIVNTLPFFQDITRKHRFPRATALLTGVPGMAPHGLANVDKTAAKRGLGLDPEKPVIMTIGAEPYFIPNREYDFFKTALWLLDKLPAATLLVVGVPVGSCVASAEVSRHPRVRLVGPVVDPRPYYEASDVCLESFPMPSLGALVESVAYGEAFPVPVYGAGDSALRVPLGEDYAFPRRSKTEDAYVKSVLELMDDPEGTRERAAMIRRSLVELDRQFPERLRRLNERIDGLEHSPGDIPASPMDGSRDSQELAARGGICVGAELDGLLPPRFAWPAHIRAAVCGRESWREALRRMASRPPGMRLLRKVGAGLGVGGA